MRHNTTHKTMIIMALLLLPIFSASATMAADGPGSAGAGYLLRSVGPKSIAMGEVKAALEGDPFNWLYNPGVLPTMKKSGLGLSHAEWIIDTRYNSLIGNMKATNWLTLGGGIIYEYGQDIQGYDDFGQLTDPLKNYNYQAVLGLGFGPFASLSGGINLKYFRETLSEWNAGGFGVDAGVFYDLPLTGIKLGASVQNLGGDIKFIEREEPIPTTIRAGAIYSMAPVPKGVGFSFGLDIVKPRFSDAYIGAGLELRILSMVALRGGWTGQKDRSGDGFTLGAGVNLDDRISVDYAASSYGDLGTMHRISVYFGIR